mgnify:CR=1 FL=1
MNLIVKTKDLSEFFGVTRQSISEWRKNGCPQVKRGTWDLKQVFDWWWENIASDRAAKEGGDASMNEAKRIYWWEKAKGEEYKNKQLNEALIPKDNIGSEWAKRAAEYKAGCFELEHSLPPLLEGKSQPAMRKIVYDKVWSIFDRACRTGRFTPKEARPAKKKKAKTKK